MMVLFSVSCKMLQLQDIKVRMSLLIPGEEEVMGQKSLLPATPSSQTRIPSAVHAVLDHCSVCVDFEEEIDKENIKK